MKKIILSTAGIFLLFSLAYSQSYNLSQSTASYSSISGTTVASGSTWNPHGYKIPIGFSFSFIGKSFDSLTVSSNGFLLFGDDNERAIAAFKGIMPLSASTVSYSASGGVLKIEFTNVGFESSSDNFNFQIWLEQSGNKVSFHTGTTNLSTAQDSLIMPVLGIVNPSMDQSNNGYLITGNPSSATKENLVSDMKYLIRVPDPNTVYTLTP